MSEDDTASASARGTDSASRVGGSTGPALALHAVRRVPAAELVLCPYCDVVHRRTHLAGRKTARCVNCDGPLYRGNGDLGAMLAVTLTAATGFVVANSLPLLTLTSQGQQTRATLWRAIVASYDRQLPLVATALLVTLIVAPAIEIGLLLWALVPLCLRTRPLGFESTMWLLRTLRPWRMTEVFFLGVVVAAVKLSGIATAVPGWGAFGVAVVTFSLASLAAFDQGALWQRAEEASP